MTPRDQAFALILGGGSGTRLWPASRRARSKQFLTLGGRETLLEASVRRAVDIFGLEYTLVVTAADQAEACRKLLPQLPPQNLILEPAGRNTAAAVGLGTVFVARRAGEQARIAVLPADAHVSDEQGFAAAVRTALGAAGDAIVTIGIRPLRPETGFGYLHVGKAVSPGVFEVVRFEEKPDAATAERYLASGDYLWNSGMFFFTAGRLLADTRRLMPELGRVLDAIRAAGDPLEVTSERYPSVPATSIDYGIMEKAAGIRVARGDFGWNDVGSWAALDSIRAPDAAGNVLVGDVLVVDAQHNVVLSEDDAPLVGVVGVEDLVVIATRSAVLVVPKARAQEVRKIVEKLAAEGRTGLL